jgi:hypothetical protein
MKFFDTLIEHMKRFFSKTWLILFAFVFSECSKKYSLPVPDHIVIAILENHAYSQIIGSDSAPYINSLANDSFSANFINSFALKHPSQPNYLNLFAGSSQGISDNTRPPNAPFSSPNLARQLINVKKSFFTYSENLPFAGFDGDSSNGYVRKHNPSTNWVGAGPNQISRATNQPFTSFPKDFSKLPTVSIVVPDLYNDMHDGSINAGDSWLKNNLNNYVQWAKKNNSLFILTFDEDDGRNNNHIVTIFTGKTVRKGEYSNKIIHYNILRTIEDMYRLSYAGNASLVKPITNCWR